MSAAITAKKLSYERGRRMLVDGISLSIEPGCFTVVVGPNGAGKSTLLKLLSGEAVPSAGDVSFHGQPIARMPAWQLAQIRAVMPQASDLNFPFLVEEVVSLGVEGIGRGLSRGDRHDCIDRALQRADIADLRMRFYQTLSGGERQRVHFARVLAQLAAGRSVDKRQVLFLDEPISSLDLKHQLGVIGEAQALTREGVTVVAVLHDLQLAASASEDIVLLNRGRLVARGSPGVVLTEEHLAGVFGVRLGLPHLPPLPWTAL